MWVASLLVCVGAFAPAQIDFNKLSPDEAKEMRERYEKVLIDGRGKTTLENWNRAFNFLPAIPPDGYKSLIKVYPVFVKRSEVARKEMAAAGAGIKKLPPVFEQNDRQLQMSHALIKKIDAARDVLKEEYRVLWRLAHFSKRRADVIPALPDSAIDSLMEMLPIYGDSDDREAILLAAGRFGPRAKKLLPKLRELREKGGYPGADEAVRMISGR
jgi:hypothetical protein